MGQMKGFLITVHNGGDEAVAAVQRVSEDWRAQLEQAADEIERLRLAIRRLAEQDATLSVCDGNVMVTMDATLTDEEREAVEACAVLADKTDLTVSGFGGQWKPRAATLRGLLSRMGDCPEPDNAADRDSGTTGSE